MIFNIYLCLKRRNLLISMLGKNQPWRKTLINIFQTIGLSLHQGATESRKNLEQKFIFQIGTLNPHGINECFSFN